MDVSAPGQREGNSCRRGISDGASGVGTLFLEMFIRMSGGPAFCSTNWELVQSGGRAHACSSRRALGSACVVCR